MSARPPPKPTPEPSRGNPGWFPVTSEEFERRMHALHRTLKSVDDHILAVEESITRIGESIVSTQADVDALTQAVNDLEAQVTADDAALTAAVTDIQAEITALQNQNPTLDLSALQAKVTEAQGAVTTLGDAVTSVSALVPPATA